MPPAQPLLSSNLKELLDVEKSGQGNPEQIYRPICRTFFLMHRQQILNLLEEYTPFHSSDREAKARTLDFVRSTPDCFDRELYAPGHITGSCWILNEKQDAVLLTHHRKLNIWIQPGGHVDGESDVLAAALREAYEESGLSCIEPLSEHIYDIDIHRFPERQGTPAHLHFDIRFAFQAKGDESYTVSEESHDLRWVPIHDMRAWNTDLSMTRMADKWIERKS